MRVLAVSPRLLRGGRGASKPIPRHAAIRISLGLNLGLFAACRRLQRTAQAVPASAAKLLVGLAATCSVSIVPAAARICRLSKFSSAGDGVTTQQSAPMMMRGASLLVAVAALAEAGGEVFDVTKFGAVGDGTTYDTPAVRKAAAALLAGGEGGTLLFPGPGKTYLTGAFNLSSHTHVEIEPGATVLGSTRGEDWPLLVAATVWPQMGHGSDCPPGAESCRLMHQALVFSWGQTNVSLGGGGALDCNARKDTWWSCARDLSKPPCSGYGRPHCMMLSNVTDVEVSHLHVSNSPDWTLHFSAVTRLHVHHMNVTNPDEPNADGLDIDSTQDALIEDNHFSVGDDALCVKSGIDWFGRQFARPAKNIMFRRNVIGRGHGITIGSEMSGGVSNVTFEDITMDQTGTGVRMKSERGRGNVVEDVTYRRIDMKDIDGQCVQVTLNYAKGIKPTNKTATPVFRNILLEDVRCDKGGASYFIDGLQEQHIMNLTLKNVTMGKEVGKQAACDNADCTCDSLTAPCPTCCTKLL